MKKWQNSLIVDVFKIDFNKDSKIIKEAFSRLCNPLTKYDGINFNAAHCLLEVGNVFYRLTIGANGINISKRYDNGNTKSVSYIVNTDNVYEYKNITIDKIYETGRLESVDFDYESIIDKLMDILIVQP